MGRRTATVIAFLSLFSSSAMAAPEFEGMWLTCAPGMHTRGQYLLRVIKWEGGMYVTGEEWGQNYSRSGTGTVAGDRLIVRGCTYFRGEVASDCDEENPPVIFTLDRATAGKEPKSLVAALRRGDTVRVTEKTWHASSGVCKDLAEHQR